MARVGTTYSVGWRHRQSKPGSLLCYVNAFSNTSCDEMGALGVFIAPVLSDATTNIWSTMVASAESFPDTRSVLVTCDAVDGPVNIDQLFVSMDPNPRF
jgi:hypothetical protein